MFLSSKAVLWVVEWPISPSLSIISTGFMQTGTIRAVSRQETEPSGQAGLFPFSQHPRCCSLSLTSIITGDSLPRSGALILLKQSTKTPWNQVPSAGVSHNTVSRPDHGDNGHVCVHQRKEGQPCLPHWRWILTAATTYLTRVTSHFNVSTLSIFRKPHWLRDRVQSWKDVLNLRGTSISPSGIH